MAFLVNHLSFLLLFFFLNFHFDAILKFTGFKFLTFCFGKFLVLQERSRARVQISFSFCRIAGSVMLKNKKFQRQQMKLKRWGSSEKRVELGFGLRNEKALLMERE